MLNHLSEESAFFANKKIGQFCSYALRKVSILINKGSREGDQIMITGSDR